MINKDFFSALELLETEKGISLDASGWKYKYTTTGGSWDTPSRRRIDKAPTEPKKLYEAELTTKIKN